MHCKRFALLSMGLALLALEVAAEPAAALDTAKDKVSYAIGVDVARNFRKQSVEFDPDVLAKGMRDGVAGARLQMSEKELRYVLNTFQAEVRQKMAQSRRVAADENRRKGLAFQEENRKREGVVSLPSGLQYKVLKTGGGRKPAEGDMVECNYRGTLLDATEFDGTEPGRPANLKMASLIAGWKEAMKLMAEGSKWELVIPPQLAYGERGVGSDIGPNETLLFEVELVAVR